MPPTNARLGATRARAVLRLHADEGATVEMISREVGIGLESVRAVLRGQTYRRLARGLPMPARRADLAADALDAMLDRRLELITAHRRYGELRRGRRAHRGRR